jgi:hypothetical protein
MRLRARLAGACGLFLFAIAGLVSSTPDFSPAQDTAGPLTLSLSDPGEVKTLNRPVPIAATVTNSGPVLLSGTVSLWTIDDWRVEGESTRTFTLEPKAARSLSFAVLPSAKSYAALYPVHARAEFRTGGAPTAAAHAVLILPVSADAVTASSVARLPLLRLRNRGHIRLDLPNRFQPGISVHNGPPAPKPVGWTGTDEPTGALVQLTSVERGDRRSAIGVHPPWRHAWGETLLDYHVALPSASPLYLDFATAIRDHDPARENPSDGVDFRVLVSTGGPFRTLFTRFSAAKRWEDARVDLSGYAGREITLRLFTGPGPAHDTNCDQSYWAEPILTSGPEPVREGEAQRSARRQLAVRTARDAWAGRSAPWSWRLESDAAVVGASLIAGPQGLADAFLVFADAGRVLVFDGFVVEISGRALGAGKADLPCDRVTPLFEARRGQLTHDVFDGDELLSVRTQIWAERGALRVAFDMPGARRNVRGEPRFTALMVGTASESARRVYAGFGNVIQDPGRFDLPAGGFTLSTRHVGMDFTNGLSLVQASDIFPDAFRVDPDARRYALITHHDATLSFVPSTRGAFAAARVYRGIAGFQTGSGVAAMRGRMVLDQWGGDYRQAAGDLEQAARYGLTDAVFVKHVWQRWGYDYRLPDIYPPGGRFDDFRGMVDACKRNGLLFSPHDNYIDFYPDAEGFSYDHIVFNADGTPQKAWFNKGRQALSYRWRPTAFFPWLESNLKNIVAGFAPTAYFVDVFSAMAPMDFYDRQGRFSPKTITVERWGAAFDRIHDALGPHAPTISEAGHDALIGHLDAAESDHSGWSPRTVSEQGAASENAPFRWRMAAGDGERVPWHDMASHGHFVLLAGGLGSRYAGGADAVLHGYGSDDYLSLTALGGRNPMCDGPFSRHTVMTYWLLHGVSKALAQREMLDHLFAGDDIHRQRVRFSDGGNVTVNRGETDWPVAGLTLPPYGFVAQAGEYDASVARRSGIISGFARGPGVLFVDARPPEADPEATMLPRLMTVDDLGGRRLRLRVDWKVFQPTPSGYRPFLHFVSGKEGDVEAIVFQGELKMADGALAHPGDSTSVAEVVVPETLKAPATYGVRFGLYNPAAGGRRWPLLGARDGEGRARGGQIHMELRPDQSVSLRWQPEPPDPAAAVRAERLNSEGRQVDFGPVVTNGSFRLDYHGEEWELTPLPSSSAFETTLRLDRLEAGDRRVQSLTAVDIDGNSLGPVPFQQVGPSVRLVTSGRPFAYRIRFVS